MSQRKKEEERIERIVRSLLRLPENKRCINCNNLGPQYVCTTFWTFVCTNCSGIHREFTHRIKSVSMAKFNMEEVTSLQAGGNERAREIYFKAWDPQRHSHPDASNLHKLRDFIKNVYVDRKYTGERGPDRLPMLKMGAKDNIYERRSYEKASQGLRDEFYDRNSFGRSSPSGRSPNYIDDRRSPSCNIENGRYGRGRRSRPTAQFEIVDDRFRDDDYGNRRRSESCRFSNYDSRAASMSPEPQRIRDNAILPVLRNLKDVMSEHSPTRRVMDPHKPNNGKVIDGSSNDQKTASSSNPGSVHVTPVKNKSASTSSLIDLGDTPEVPDTPPRTQTEEASSVQPSIVEKPSNSPKVNSLESLLFELSFEPAISVPEVPTSSDASSATPEDSSNGVATMASSIITKTPAVPSNEIIAAPTSIGNVQAIPCSNSNLEYQVNGGHQVQTMPQGHPSESTAIHCSFTAQMCESLLETLTDKPWPSSPASNAQQQHSSDSAEQSPRAVSRPPQHTSSGDGSKPTTRKELPVDLFAFSYPSYPAPVQNWQFRPAHGVGYGMQYPPTAAPMSVPAYPIHAKSTNPFDDGDYSVQSQAAMFPSMACVQGAFTQMPGLVGVQPRSPYASAVPSQSPPYGMSPGALMGQTLHNNMPNPRTQGNGGSDDGDAAFASLNPIRQSSHETSSPATSNSFPSAGGNPFW